MFSLVDCTNFLCFDLDFFSSWWFLGLFQDGIGPMASNLCGPQILSAVNFLGRPKVMISLLAVSLWILLTIPKVFHDSPYRSDGSKKRLSSIQDVEHCRTLPRSGSMGLRTCPCEAFFVQFFGYVPNGDTLAVAWKFTSWFLCNGQGGGSRLVIVEKTATQVKHFSLQASFDHLGYLRSQAKLNRKALDRRQGFQAFTRR